MVVVETCFLESEHARHTVFRYARSAERSHPAWISQRARLQP